MRFKLTTETTLCGHIFSPCVNFTNVLCAAFMLVVPKSVKNTVKSSVSFYAFGICTHKSCTQNVDEIEPMFPTMLRQGWHMLRALKHT